MSDEIESQLAPFEELGYRFVTRHQPQADFEEPDWIVVVHTPDGRLLFPGAVDSVEVDARVRSLGVAARDLATRAK